jgi:hypothetical protein
VKGLSEANAGGHIPASGGLILKKDESVFIARVKEYLHTFYEKKKMSNN